MNSESLENEVKDPDAKFMEKVFDGFTSLQDEYGTGNNVDWGISFLNKISVARKNSLDGLSVVSMFRSSIGRNVELSDDVSDVRKDVDESNAVKICACLSYLISRGAVAFDLECMIGLLQDVFPLLGTKRCASIPISLEFLNYVDLDDKEQVEIAIAYLLGMIPYGVEERNLGVSNQELLRRLGIVYKRSQMSVCSFLLGMNIPFVLYFGSIYAALSGFYPFSIDFSREDVEKGLNFLLFFNSAEDDDVYVSDRDYGEWGILTLNGDVVHWNVNYIRRVFQIADGWTKNQIESRFSPVRTLMINFDDSLGKEFEGFLQSDFFNVPACSIETIMSDMAEVLTAVKKSLIMEPDEAKAFQQYSMIASKMSEEMSDVSSSLYFVEDRNHKISTCEILILSFKMKMALSYITKHCDTAYKVVLFFTSFKTDMISYPFTQKYMPRNFLNPGSKILEILIILWCFGNVMEDEKIVEIIIDGASFHDNNESLKIPSSSDWIQMLNIFSSSENVLYEWAYKAIVSN